MARAVEAVAESLDQVFDCEGPVRQRKADPAMKWAPCLVVAQRRPKFVQRFLSQENHASRLRHNRRVFTREVARVVRDLKADPVRPRNPRLRRVERVCRQLRRLWPGALAFAPNELALSMGSIAASFQRSRATSFADQKKPEERAA